MLSGLYAAVARRRREWYAAHPEERQRLRHPVISIGNIAVGGRGKTPFTATVARMLLELGETPAILSRGYARTRPADGAVVVRDTRGMRADLARSGDEPLMLARQLEGAIVVSGADRYVGGRLAEHHLGATVHLLDDGFQHFRLDRDVDIVLVSKADLNGASTLPAGRLREPADVLIAADAVVCTDDDAVIDIPHAAVFRAVRAMGTVTFGDQDSPPSPDTGPVLGLAGIANPQSFYDELRRAGWRVVVTRSFADHHPYSRADLDRLVADAAAAQAVAILTTEKDYVRLLPHRPFRIPIGVLPLTMTPEPADEFRRWLAAVLDSARDIPSG